MKFVFLIILIVIALTFFWVLLASNFRAVGKFINEIIKPFKNMEDEIDEKEL